jgi:hypothetical protein
VIEINADHSLGKIYDPRDSWLEGWGGEKRGMGGEIPNKKPRDRPVYSWSNKKI